MNLITPPTDSFYKFIGIGGLFVFIACGIFLFSTIYKSDHELTKAQGELRQVDYNISSYLELILHDPKNGGFKQENYDRLNNFARGGYMHWPEKDSTFFALYFSLPDTVRSRIESLSELRSQKLIAFNTTNDKINSIKDNESIMFGLLLFGEIVGGLGIMLWYFHNQSPADVELRRKELQERLRDKDLKEYCQSCHTYFLSFQERGTEADGSYSVNYCCECYYDGKFTNPELTFKVALDAMIENATKLKYKPKKIKRLRKEFNEMLRWKRQKTL